MAAVGFTVSEAVAALAAAVSEEAALAAVSAATLEEAVSVVGALNMAVDGPKGPEAGVWPKGRGAAWLLKDREAMPWRKDPRAVSLRKVDTAELPR